MPLPRPALKPFVKFFTSSRNHIGLSFAGARAYPRAPMNRIDAAFDEVIGQVRQETANTLDAIKCLPPQERIVKEEQAA